MKVMAPNRINSISSKAHIQIRKNSMSIFFDCQMTHFICATLFCFLHTTRKYARYLNLLLWEVTRSNGCHRYTSAQNWFAISIESNIMQKRCSSLLTLSFWIKSWRKCPKKYRYEEPLAMYTFQSIRVTSWKCNDFATQTFFNLLSWKCSLLCLFTCVSLAKKKVVVRYSALIIRLVHAIKQQWAHMSR